MTAEEKFKLLADKFVDQNEDVHLGKMMSSPGLKCLLNTN